MHKMFLGLTKLTNYKMKKYNKIECVGRFLDKGKLLIHVSTVIVFSCFDSHIEHHLEMTKTTKSNSSLKKYLKELYPH